MNLALRIDNNVVAIIVSTIFLINLSRRIDKSNPKIWHFYLLFTLNTLELTLETITCIINHQPYRFLIPVTSFIHMILFISGPLIIYIWFVFVYLWVNDNKKIDPLYNLLLLLPALANALLVLANPFFKWIFYISPDNIYYRGALYLVPSGIAYFYLLASFIYVFSNKKKVDKVEFYPLLFFSVFPALGGLIQAMYYGVLLLWSNIAYSLIIVYIYLQQKIIEIDPLTGAWTREKLNHFIRNRSKQKNVNPFALVFLDIDDFKTINDSFGHLEGDKALAKLVEIVNRQLGPGEFIARYGGDEFIIFLDVSSRTETEAKINQVIQGLDAFNHSENHPYELYFTYGYELFYLNSDNSFDECIRCVDELMYKAKREKKEAEKGAV